MPSLQRNPKIEEAPLQQELMLFNPVSSQFYLLNSTMTYIWRNCEGRTVDDLLAGIEGAFETAQTRPEQDEIRTALADLMSLGLLVDESASQA